MAAKANSLASTAVTWAPGWSTSPPPVPSPASPHDTAVITTGGGAGGDGGGWSGVGGFGDGGGRCGASSGSFGGKPGAGGGGRAARMNSLTSSHSDT